MAEFGSRGGDTSGGRTTSSPNLAHGKVAFKAGDGEGGGGGSGIARIHLDSARNGVSNGDCALVGNREHIDSLQPGSPAVERGCSNLHPEGKSGIPKKASIIKVRQYIFSLY